MLCPNKQCSVDITKQELIKNFQVEPRILGPEPLELELDICVVCFYN